MNLLIINTHLAYAGWSEGKLNLALMHVAKVFFAERGHAGLTQQPVGLNSDEQNFSSTISNPGTRLTAQMSETA